MARDVDVQVFPPSASHRTVAGVDVPMTWGRAAMVLLISEYMVRRGRTEPWEEGQGASALEIQKLMYFANQNEPTLHLRFEQGKYGPYSDKVRQLIQEMEGTFLEGFGDGADRVLSLEPIMPTDRGLRDARNFDAAHGHRVTMGVVRRTLDIVAGFENAYGLELLGTVHWVLGSSPGASAQDVTDKVHEWSKRKGWLFTAEHVEVAMRQLNGSTPAART